MAFRHISKVLADVMADIESERAAGKVAQGICGDKPSAVEEENRPDLSPAALELGGVSATHELEKEAGAVEAPASSDREETSGNLGQPVLRLVMGSRDRCTAIAASQGQRPSPAVHLSLVS